MSDRLKGKKVAITAEGIHERRGQVVEAR